MPPKITDEELLRLAEQELLGEAKKGEARYSVSGPSGWRPSPLMKVNKPFLVNTLLHTLSSNRVLDRQKKGLPPPKKRERKLLQVNSSQGKNSTNFLFKKSSSTKKSDKCKDSKDKVKISSKSYSKKTRDLDPKCSGRNK